MDATLWESLLNFTSGKQQKSFLGFFQNFDQGLVIFFKNNEFPDRQNNECINTSKTTKTVHGFY